MASAETKSTASNQTENPPVQEPRLFPLHLPFREQPDRDATVRFNEAEAALNIADDVQESWYNGIVNSDSMSLTITPDKIRELAYFGATELRKGPILLTDSSIFRTCLRWLIIFQNTWMVGKNDTDLRLLAMSWNELLHHGPQTGDQRSLFLDHATKSYQQFYEASPTDNNFSTARILGRIMVQEAVTPRELVQAHKRMGTLYGVRINRFPVAHDSWRPIINTSIHHLNLAIAKLEEFPDLEPVASDNDLWEHCAWALEQRFEAAGQEKDIAMAIDYHKFLIERAKDSKAKILVYDKLARAYWKQFMHFRRVSEAKEGIAVFEKILELEPEYVSQLERSTLMLSSNPHALTGCAELMRQAASAENISNTARRDVTSKSIEMLERCIAVTSDDDAILPSRLGKLSEAFMERYTYDADQNDIDLAIMMQTTAMDLPQLPAGGRYFHHKQLSEKYVQKFQNTDDVADIEAAIQHSQKSIEHAPQNDGNERGKVKLSLARAYAAFFRSKHQIKHIDLAIDLGEESLKLSEEAGWRSIAALDDLAQFYRFRFERLQRYEDASKGIKCIREAISILRGMAGKNNLKHEAGCLTVLAALMRARAAVFQGEEDFNEAVRAERDSLKLTDVEHKEYTSRAADLSYNLIARHRILHDMADLKEADIVLDIAMQSLSTRKAPATNKERGLLENQYAIVCTSRWSATNDIKWAKEATRHFEAALTADPSNLPYAQNLASTLTGVARESGTLEDAILAVKAFQTYVLNIQKYAPETADVNLPGVVENLARLAVSKLRGPAGPTFWLPVAIQLLEQLVPLTQASAGTRLWAAGERAAIAAAPQKDFKTAAKYISMAANFLPTLLNPGLSRLDLIRLTKENSNLPGFLLAFRVAAGYSVSQGLQGFEESRGVLWNRLLRENDELEILNQVDDKMAQEFRELHKRISAPRKPISSLENDTSMVFNNTDYYQDAQRYNEVIAKIRLLPGLEDFLKLPSQLDELTSYAAEGAIVIVNTAINISHAVIVVSTGVTILPLPDYSDSSGRELYTKFKLSLDTLSNKDESEATTLFNEVCLQLWTSIAKPILDKLDELLPQNSIEQWKSQPVHRIWWLTNQLINVLPLHAAGDHIQHATTRSPCTVLDRSISSYIPSFGALKFARKNDLSRQQTTTPISLPNVQASALIISMSETPGQASLPHAAEEASIVQAHLASQEIESVHLSGKLAVRKSILSELKASSVAHFICHGHVDPDDPLKSALLHAESHKAPLDVKTLIRASIPSCAMVYLSVCNAATSQTLPLVDEGLHIAGAFLMAGVPRVIGTRWELVDSLAVEVAGRVYAGLIGTQGKTDGNGNGNGNGKEGFVFGLQKSAEVLRQVLLDVRESGVAVMLLSAYVHYGI